MKTIKSKTVTIQRSVQTAFYALSDFSNIRAIPDDKVKDFKSTYDTCSFNVNGMADVELKIVERHPYDYITIASSKEIMGGFSFLLNLIFEPIDENTCAIHAEVNVDGNAIALMMIKGKLADGLDMIMDGIKNAMNV